MNFITNLKKTEIFNKIRFITATLFGMNDTRTAKESSSYGIDSNPIVGLDAIYLMTNKKSQPVIIGYIDNQKLSTLLSGEIRIYSTDANGVFKSNIICTNDANILIGNDTDKANYINNLVKYIQLESDLQATITQINTNLDLIALGMNAIMPDSYIVVPIAQDFTDSKTPNIKILE